jgi:hypothetical protein
LIFSFKITTMDYRTLDIITIVTCLKGLKLSKLLSKTRVVASIVGGSLISRQETPVCTYKGISSPTWDYPMRFYWSQCYSRVNWWLYFESGAPRYSLVETNFLEKYIFRSSSFWIIGQKTSKQRRVLVQSWLHQESIEVAWFSSMILDMVRLGVLLKRSIGSTIRHHILINLVRLNLRTTTGVAIWTMWRLIL